MSITLSNGGPLNLFIITIFALLSSCQLPVGDEVEESVNGEKGCELTVDNMAMCHTCHMAWTVWMTANDW